MDTIKAVRRRDVTMRSLRMEEFINLQLRSVKWRPKRKNPPQGELGWAEKKNTLTTDPFTLPNPKRNSKGKNSGGRHPSPLGRV